MNVDVKAPYAARVQQALADEGLRTALDRATERLSGRRVEAMAAIDAPLLREQARGIREWTLLHMADLLEELERNLQANGCTEHWANDAEEARGIVREIAQHNGVRRVVKSKSMLTEEIHLNSALEAAGIDVVETDLGEYIIQLAGEPPSHIIAPVIHKRAEDVSELFQRCFGMRPTNDPAEMCAVARQRLRRAFLEADMGVSGCNFAVAETGTICVITNEGNGRMVTSLPRVYVAIAGIEKVVRGVEDAVLLWQAASRSATGQNVSVYFSMSSGPRPPGHADGPEAMHVVLLDNGRSRVVERGYGEALLCIRCGACLNVCPVYREIGGHAYGETAYNGPIGAVLTPLLADDPASVRDLPYASTLCGACRDACPVKIDLPGLLLDLRRDLVERKATPAGERMAMRAFASTMEQPRRYHRLVRAARWVMRLWRRGPGGAIEKLPPPFNAWTRTRAFPSLPAERFTARWERRRRVDADEHR
jgi:L-lactate dehydrogenase complex protein LldF